MTNASKTKNRRLINFTLLEEDARALEKAAEKEGVNVSVLICSRLGFTPSARPFPAWRGKLKGIICETMLSAPGPIRMKDLAASSGASLTSVWSQLRRLRASRHVAVTEDGRFKLYSLTPEGRRIHESRRKARAQGPG